MTPAINALYVRSSQGSRVVQNTAQRLDLPVCLVAAVVPVESAGEPLAVRFEPPTGTTGTTTPGPPTAALRPLNGPRRPPCHTDFAAPAVDRLAGHGGGRGRRRPRGRCR